MADAYSTFVSIQPSAAELMRSKGPKSLFERVRSEDTTTFTAGTGIAPTVRGPYFSIVSGAYSNTITFAPVAGGTSYNLYWSSAPGVTKSSSKVAGVSSPYVHPGLTGGQPYYYAMSTVTAGGEGPLGAEQMATPTATVASSTLLAPVLDSVTSPGTVPPTLFAQWRRTDLRAVSSNLYWGTSPGITKNSTKIAGLSAYSQTLSGIDYAQSYYAAISSVMADGTESALSLELSATTQNYTFSISTSSAGTVATNVITFGTYKADTTSFNIYWSLTPGVTKSSNKITGATSPYTHTGLTCTTPYYYAIAAVGSGGEGPLCPELSITTPQATYMPGGAVLKLDSTDVTSWPGSGTQWKDIAGNGYHVTGVSAALFGTYNGNTVFRTPGNAYYSPLTLSQAIPCTVLTVARYNNQGSNLRGRVISSGTTNWLLGWHSNRAGVFYSAGWVANSNNITGDSAWHCAIGTGKTNDYHFYDNGSELTESPTAGTSGPGVLTIGGYSAGEYSNADVALLMVWNRVLTATECAQAFDAVATKFGIFSSADPLIDTATQALYKFESIPLVDSAKGYNLSMTGSAVQDSNGRKGGKCVDFNNAAWGSISISTAGHPLKNTFMNDCTVEGWLYYPTGRTGTFPEWFFYAGSSNATAGRGITAFVDWTNAYGGNRKIVWLLYPGSDVQYVGADTAFDTWTHFAFRRKYDTTASNWLNEVWQNGVQVASGRSAALPAGTVSALYVGSDYSSAAFAGKLDSLRISNKYRSDAEITSYFNNT